MYRAFGEQLKKLGEGEATYTYGGKELDVDTNLYYFNARYYDATIGRFINVDPIQDGTNWYVYCHNNPLSFVDPTGLVDVKSAAKLATASYSKTAPKGWEIVNPEDLGWKGSQQGHDKSGFEAVLYRNQDTGEYAYTFCGTNDDQEWVHTNGAQLIGLTNQQYEFAIYNTKMLKEYVGDSKLTIIGHSLGGGLASAAAVVSGLEAITFNAAGVNPATLTRWDVQKCEIGNIAKKLVTAYYMEHDILSFLQDNSPAPNALGNRIMLKGRERLPISMGFYTGQLEFGIRFSGNQLSPINNIDFGVENHFMEAVNRSLGILE